MKLYELKIPLDLKIKQTKTNRQTKKSTKTKKYFCIVIKCCKKINK